MSRYTFDLEANGLYWEANKIHCICTHNMETGATQSFHGAGIMNGINELMEAEELIGHSIVNYDLALIAKLYPSLPKYKGIVFDTLIFSQLLKPERYGGHSLGRFGELLHYPKVEHENWETYSPEMLHRCKTDVELNVKVYHMLQREASEEIKGVRLWTS